MARKFSVVGKGVGGKALHKIDCALSPFETKLVNKLGDGGDVKISVLFRMRYGRWPAAFENNRHQQQAISGSISQANRKLAAHRLRIVPGEKRQTYHIVGI